VHLDKALAYLGIVASVILVIYLALTTGRLVYMLAGVLVLLSCLLWLAIRENAQSAFPGPQLAGVSPGKDRLSAVLFILFLALYVLSIAVLYLRASQYERPPGYFILTSLMAGVIAVETLLPCRRKASEILLQVILLGISVVWSQILIIPGMMQSDPWAHKMFVLQMLDLHTIPQGYMYTYIPLFHLEIAGTSLLAGLDYRLATMFSVSLAQLVIFPLVIYSLGTALFNDERIGLLGGLMLITANQQISMGVVSIPNAFAAVFMALVIYLLFKLKSTSPIWARNLALILLFAIILTHTITAACMALVLYLTWGACRFYDHIRRDGSTEAYPVTLALASLFLATMLGWWYFVSGHFAVLLDLIRQGFSQDYFVQNPRVIDIYHEFVPVLEQIFNNTGMFLFFALSLVGIFYLVARRERNGFALGVVGITILALGFFPLVTGLSFIEHRWWYFAQIFLSVPLTASLLLVIGRSRKRTVTLLFAACISLFVFAMIASPAANNDNPFLSPNSAVRTGFTKSELRAFDTVDSIRAGPVGADRYARVVNYVASDPDFIIPIDEMLIEGAYRSHGISTVLVRDYIRDHTIICYDGMFRLTHDPERTLDREEYDRVYESGSASLFVLNNS